MKRIYLTVDTECHDFDRVNQYIWGKTKNGEFGIRKILELAKEEDIPVNFFLDVVECRRYGDEYIEDIVSLIKSYGQPIFLHLHPDFVTNKGDGFLWEYDKVEQFKILEAGISDYKRLVGDSGRLIFRAGRYGVNRDTYEALSELEPDALDLSYCYDASHVYKMCHLTENESGTKNLPTHYQGITILPNTNYVGFDYFGYKKLLGVDASEMTFDEFKRYFDLSDLSNVVWTMHSWNFIKKWFFLPHYAAGNKAQIKKFKECVKFAKERGYEFANLKDFNISGNYVGETDEPVDLCKGHKIRQLFNNFVRFQNIGRLTKKYFFIYLTFYLILIALIILIITLL